MFPQQASLHLEISAIHHKNYSKQEFHKSMREFNEYEKKSY